MKNLSLSEHSDMELFELYDQLMRELRGRKVIHSSNNPVANYAENLASKALSLTMLPESTKGFDATDENGVRYEIKGRRPTAENTSRQLSMIRELDKKHFDFLIGILFHENFVVHKACVIPHNVVLQRSKYTKHANAWIFQLRDDIWQINGVRDITRELKTAQMA